MTTEVRFTASGGEPDSARDEVLSAIKETIVDSLWIVDRDARLLDCNRQFENSFRMIFGMNARLGDRIADLISRRFPDATRAWNDVHRRVFEGTSVLTETTLLVARSRRRFSIHGTPVGKAPASAIFLARDITDFRRNDGYDFVKTFLARLLAEEPSVPAMFRRFLESFCTSIGCEMGIAWLSDDAGQRLHAAASWAQGNAAIELEDSLKGLTIGRGDGLAGHVWASEQPMWIADLADETLPVRPLRSVPPGARAAILFPMRDSTRVIGVLATFMRRAHAVEPNLIESFHEIGSTLGRYVERRHAHAEQDRLRGALERKGHEWTLTFDAIDSPLLILDPEANILRVNRAARQLAGYANYSDLLGRNLSTMIAEPHWRTLYEAVTTVRDLRSSYSLQFYDEERRRYWDMSASYAPARSREDDKIIVILRDITSLIELQNSVRRSEQLSAMGELVAGVAHEVRNPLFGMQAAVDALEMSILTDDGRELTAALRTWVDRLNTLMSQLLEYGKTWTMNLAEGTVSGVLQHAIENCTPLAATADVTIRSSIGEELPILLDAGRLVQVFQNLITNAVQFSPRGEIVDVELSRGIHDGVPVVECVVRDRGAGFDAKDLHRVFQPFFTRRRGGTGLGLSIVQRIVDEHGGTVSACNHPSGGGMVSVCFPPFRHIAGTR